MGAIKVYVITAGEYSDYHICAVTLIKERAEVLKRYYSSTTDEATIEEYDTLEPHITGQPRKVFSLHIEKDGTVNQYGKQAWTFDEKFENHFHLWSSNPWNDHYGWTGRFDATVVADDFDHAVKIALDQRAKELAEAQGL